MSEWKDISTAPRDGTAIIITCAGSLGCNATNTYVAAFWDEEESLFTDDESGAWVCYMDMTQEPQAPINPTHWMPLPPPPNL